MLFTMSIIGDAITSGLKDIVYNTYNGELELLKNVIRNRNVDEFVRSEVLDVKAQLYIDGILEENEWKEFIKQNVYSNEEYNNIYTGLGTVICDCHFVDMLPEIRYMLNNGLMDEASLGGYDSCVDYMFEYSYHKENFCESSINAADMLKHWAMFDNDSEERDVKKNSRSMEKALKDLKKKRNAAGTGT